MAFLIPDSTYIFTAGGKTYTVNKRIIPANARRKTPLEGVGYFVKPGVGIDGGKPRGITVHNTADISVAAGTNAAEQYSRATWPNCNMGTVCVHYYVWHSEIWQNLEDTERGWHAADGSARRNGHRETKIGGNVDTVAVECIGEDAETEETVARLVAYLCDKYDLNPQIDVYTHNYFMYGKDEIVPGARKNCPLYILPHWGTFLSSVKAYFDACNLVGEDEGEKDATAPEGYLYAVQTGAFKVRENASNYKATLEKMGISCFVSMIDGLYKVQTGAFRNRANADAYATKLNAKGLATVVVLKEV